MFNVHLTPRHKHPQGSGPAVLYTFAMGRQFNAGAESEVFMPRLATALVDMEGGGIITGSLRVVEGQVIYVPKAVSLQGVPSQSGLVRLQPLVDLAQNM